MKKRRLKVSFEYNFILIGISCHAKDYRLCWEINSKLGLKLERKKDICTENSIMAKPDATAKKKELGNELIKEEANTFSCYHYKNQEKDTDFVVVSNKNAGSILIPEQKQADYFLRMSGDFSSKEKDNFVKDLRNIPVVLTAFLVDPIKLRSKQNLLLF